ncbi:hypothetical protein [Bacillus thuringiensis]|uniref:hypothetical protein n=1 Tax=Bacillus thuringiensis TaxID=1428 RepID=UPI000BFE6058|nr:hypothetical protein [Bacillus thuringiensis]PGT90104.1 hypothetical protein COD17_10160 [Bacillus thuringiensis]
MTNQLQIAKDQVAKQFKENNGLVFIVSDDIDHGGEAFNQLSEGLNLNHTFVVASRKEDKVTYHSPAPVYMGDEELTLAKKIQWIKGFNYNCVSIISPTKDECLTFVEQWKEKPVSGYVCVDAMVFEQISNENAEAGAVVVFLDPQGQIEEVYTV